MREGFPTIEKFESFRPEDAEKLSEITRIREELLKSEALPKEAKDALSGLKIKEKSKEVFEALETHEQERETIGVNEEKKEVRIDLARSAAVTACLGFFVLDLAGLLARRYRG